MPRVIDQHFSSAYLNQDRWHGPEVCVEHADSLIAVICTSHVQVKSAGRGPSRGERITAAKFACPREFTCQIQDRRHEKHRIRQRKSVTTCAKGGGHRELAARRVPGHRNTAFAGSRRLPCDEPAVCVQCIVGGSGKGIAWS